MALISNYLMLLDRKMLYRPWTAFNLIKIKWILIFILSNQIEESRNRTNLILQFCFKVNPLNFLC